MRASVAVILFFFSGCSHPVPPCDSQCLAYLETIDPAGPHQYFTDFDANGDQLVTLDEWRRLPVVFADAPGSDLDALIAKADYVFMEADTLADGRLTFTEFKTIHEKYLRLPPDQLIERLRRPNQ